MGESVSKEISLMRKHQFPISLLLLTVGMARLLLAVVIPLCSIFFNMRWSHIKSKKTSMLPFLLSNVKIFVIVTSQYDFKVYIGFRYSLQDIILYPNISDRAVCGQSVIPPYLKYDGSI